MENHKTSEEKRAYANKWYHENRDRLLAERMEAAIEYLKKNTCVE